MQQVLTSVTCAAGGGIGTGTWSTGLGQGSCHAAVKTRLTLLTVSSLGVVLAVQTRSWKERTKVAALLQCYFLDSCTYHSKLQLAVSCCKHLPNNEVIYVYVGQDSCQVCSAGQDGALSVFLVKYNV